MPDFTAVKYSQENSYKQTETQAQQNGQKTRTKTRIER